VARCSIWVVLLSRGQDKPEFPPLGGLLQRFEHFASLVAALEICGSSSLPDYVDGIELDNGGEPALSARLFALLL